MQKPPNLQALLLFKVVTAQQDHLPPQTFCKFYQQELKRLPVEDGNWEKENTGVNYKCPQSLQDNQFF